MADPRFTGDRMWALFILGVLLFNPPLLNIFDVGVKPMVFGIPLLFVYLFTAWAVLIAFITLVIERRPRSEDTAREEETAPPPG